MDIKKEFETLVLDAMEFLRDDAFIPANPQETREFKACTECSGYQGPNPYVYGVGSDHPKLLILGDQPGQDEASRARSFNKEAGELFVKMLKAMKLTGNDVFISTAYKCAGVDMGAFECEYWLLEQIKRLNPSYILALGEKTSHKLMGSSIPLEKTRGVWFDYKGIKTMPTYHPEDMLRDPSLKRAVWNDLQVVMGVL